MTVQESSFTLSPPRERVRVRGNLSWFKLIANTFNPDGIRESMIIAYKDSLSLFLKKVQFEKVYYDDDGLCEQMTSTVPAENSEPIISEDLITIRCINKTCKAKLRIPSEKKFKVRCTTCATEFIWDSETFTKTIITPQSTSDLGTRKVQGLEKPPSNQPEQSNELGNQLVALLGASLRNPRLGDSLRKLARECQPSVGEDILEKEVVFYHMFLLVQACASLSHSQLVTSFYDALDDGLLIRMGNESLAEFKGLWTTRAMQYEEPFDLDKDKWLENPPNHIPFKGLVTRFMRHFKSDISHPSEVSGALQACVNTALILTFLIQTIVDMLVPDEPDGSSH